MILKITKVSTLDERHAQILTMKGTNIHTHHFGENYDMRIIEVEPKMFDLDRFIACLNFVSYKKSRLFSLRILGIDGKEANKVSSIN